jgi:uncharacterized membrane protein YeaQ/YmgE (transglycosylase-associated protein family)
MTLIGFLLLILVGAICGGIAEFIVGFRPGGFIASTVVGFVGAFIGSWIAPRIGLPSLLAVRVEGHSIEVIWSVLGAILLLLVMSAFRRRKVSRWSII